MTRGPGLMRSPPIIRSSIAVVLGLWFSDVRGAAPDGGPEVYDVVVYSGTPAGVMSAVAAGRQGRNVALVDLNGHVGGVVSGGLVETDIGDRRTVGGLAAEFLQRITGYYTEKYGADSREVALTRGAVQFEPHVAEFVFDAMLREAKVSVFRRQRFRSTLIKGGKIESLTVDDLAGGGVKTYAGRVFVDASYEGDLMAAAHVPYRVGREARTEYGESLAGVGVGPDKGQGDERLMSYNFRVNLTDRVENRALFPRPAHYDPAPWKKSFGERIPKEKITDFIGLLASGPGRLGPNRKLDLNWGDLAGASDGYADGTWAVRSRIAARYRDSFQSMLFYLQNDPGLPVEFHANLQRWGLPLDEFVDSGHFPFQLYVREARRMVGAYLLKQDDITQDRYKPDGVCEGSYGIDCHVVREIELGGTRTPDSTPHTAIAGYDIPYGCLVPLDEPGQPVNLLVPVCLSATHVAYCSLRMEPVFMMLGQAAGDAAHLALAQGTAVQKIEVGQLRALLRKEGAILDSNYQPQVKIAWAPAHPKVGETVRLRAEWGELRDPVTEIWWDLEGNGSIGGRKGEVEHAFALEKTYHVSLVIEDRAGRRGLVAADVPVGNAPKADLSVNGFDAERTGRWDGGVPRTPGTRMPDVFTGPGVLHDVARRGVRAGASLSFQARLPASGRYEVCCGFRPAANQATNVAITVRSAKGDARRIVNERLAAPSPFPCVVIGEFAFSAGEPATVTVDNQGADGEVVMDEIRWVWRGAAVVAAAPAAVAGSDLAGDAAQRPTEPTRLVTELAAGRPQHVVIYGTSLSAGGAWVTQLKDALDRRYPGLATLTNGAKNGQNSRWGVANVAERVIAHRPDAVFIEFTINDSVARFDLSLEESRRNLETIVDRISAALPRCEIILQIMNPAVGKHPGESSYRRDQDGYQQIYRDVAAARGLLVIDHSTAWRAVIAQGGEAEFLRYVHDGVHPNAEGNAKYVTPAILAAIELPAGPSTVAAPKPAGSYYGVFRELPVQDITPEGWLAEFLQRQRDGLGLRYDLSGYPFDTCLWAGQIPGNPRADGKPSLSPVNWDRYEQTAYLIDGLYRCGLLLQDFRLEKLGEDNVRYVLEHPAANGRLGPERMSAISLGLIGGGKEGVIGRNEITAPQTPTQWPFAVFSRVLMAYYAATGDRRLLDELTTHYLGLPADFGRAPRDVDTVEGMCWLYGQTGDQRVLDKAEQTYRTFAALPKSKWALDYLAAASPMSGHGVSVCEATKQPALLYLYTGKKEYLDAVVGGFTSIQRDDEMVDGVNTSDSGLSGKNPDHEHETCCISDYSWSLGYVLQASGDAHWADTIERCVLNAGLSVVAKDFKSLEYYASPNQVVATNNSMTPTVGVKYREHQAYRPDFSIQCCTGNVHRFLPNYAARMWMTDAKGGVVAAFYGPSTLHMTAGEQNLPVSISEKTDYPFDGAVRLTVSAAQPVRFPLYLRIPGWAEAATISVNGQPVTDQLVAGTFYQLDRTFVSGDVVALNFPMKVRMEHPVQGGISLVRGPLVYSLKIKVDAKLGTKRVPNTLKYDPSFPSWDLTAASPWNYALALSGPADLGQVKVSVSPIQNFPWTPESSPVVLTVPARKVPGWRLTRSTTPAGATVLTNPALPRPPLRLAEETEQVELIPDGATQLRITVFPALPASAPVAVQ